MGLAWHNHNVAHGFFPGGGWGATWMGDPDLGAGKSQPGGWIYQQIPFMEEAALHQLGAGQNDSDKRNPLAHFAVFPADAVVLREVRELELA